MIQILPGSSVYRVGLCEGHDRDRRTVTALSHSRKRKKPRVPSPGTPLPKGSRRGLLAPILIVGIILAFIGLFLDREWTIAGLWGFSLDDSWIHAVFARNIVTGQGYAFNPGHPVSGSTGPLYSVLLALVYSVTNDMVWSAKAIGIICQCVSALFIYRAARTLDSRSEAIPVAAALLVGISPSLLWASVSGMEISLYLVFVCAGLERYVAGKDVAATLIWSLGVWVRPDGILLVALSMLGPLRSLWRRAAVAAAAIAPFFLFNWVLGGSIFPQTVGAKARWGIDLTGRTWKLVREWGALWGIPYRVNDELEHPLLLLLLLFVGAAVLWRRRPVMVLYAIGLPLAMSLFRENSASHKRYILYVIPFCVLLAMSGLRWLAARVTPRQAVRAVVAVAAICLVWEAIIASRKATTHGWNVQNINMMQRLLGTTAADLTRPGDVVAASDIGAIGYFSQREVVDVMGLVSPKRTLPDNLSVYKPALLIVIVDWFPSDARRDPASGYYAFYDADSTSKYTAAVVIELSHNTICAADQMVAFVRQKPGDAPPRVSFRRL